MELATQHYNKAVDYSQAKQFVNAASEVKEALILSPDYRDARLLLGCMYSELNQNDEALVEFQQIVAADPLDAEAHRYMGVVFAQKARQSHLREQWTASKEAYERSLALKPQDADVINGLALVFYETGDYPNALKWSMEAAVLAPKDNIITDNLAAIAAQITRKHLSQRRWKDAWQVWKMSMDAAKRTEQAKNRPTS